MHTIEFYAKKEWKIRKYFPVYVTQHYWRARHSNGNITAIGGEGYWNRADCEDAALNYKNGPYKVTWL